MKQSHKIPCSTAHLKELRKFLGKVLKELALGAIDRNALILAVDEVCANIIIHSDCEKTQSIELNVIFNEKTLIFEIIDSSQKSFDINSYTEPELQEIIKTRRKGGIGLMLVKRIMDKIESGSINGQNVCRLYKFLP